MALLVLIGGGFAYATIPGSDGSINACYDAKVGKLRLIDMAAGEQCRKPEQQVSWQQSAMLVCPDGTTLSTGVCIENAPRTAASHSEAENDCADEGRRLPGGGELNTFAEADGVTLPTGEWKDDIADTNRSGTFHYSVVGDPGTGIAEALDDVPYRCVAGAGIG